MNSSDLTKLLFWSSCLTRRGVWGYFPNQLNKHEVTFAGLEPLQIKKLYSVLQDFLICNGDLSCLCYGAIFRAIAQLLNRPKNRTIAAHSKYEVTICDRGVWGHFPIKQMAFCLIE
jgi:hypothetical protein